MRILKILVLCGLFFQQSVYSGTWTRTNDLNAKRAGFGCVILTDGRIMIFSSYRTWTYEIFNPATGVWTQGNIPNMGGDSWHPGTILLPNGKIWVVSPGSGASQVYDPNTNTWGSGPAIGYAEKAAITLLKNGKVLVAGQDQATPYTKCLLYDYQANTTAFTGSLNADHGDRPTEVLLPSGEVLIVGGSFTPRGAEVYDPAAQTWTLAPSTSYDRHGGGGIRMPPPLNNIIIIGPYAAQTEVFNPTSKTWSVSGNLNNAGRAIPAIAMLPMGKPLLMGGQLNQTCEIYDPTFGSWTLVENMTSQRCHYSAPLLYTGKVLAIGGFATSSSDTVRTTEIYDTAASVWASKPFLNNARAGHTLTPLPIVHTTNCSTNVLIVGGEDGTNFLNSCELYNYAEERIAYTVPLATARAYHTANLLPNGKVLVCGGRNTTGALNSCELYSVSGGICSWGSTGSIGTSRFNHTATLLKDGRVLITGGETGLVTLASCEIYNGSWSNTTSMANARTEHTCVLLSDGRVLVVGGRNASGVTGTCEIYNPVGGTWTTTGSLTTPRSLHTSITLQSGKILVIGGKGSTGNALPSCEIYDPTTGTWSPTQSLNAARYAHNSILIYSGLVLTMGGTDGTNYLSSCELYDPLLPLSYASNWKQTKSLNTVKAFQGCCNIPELKPYVLTIGGKSSNTTFITAIEEYDIGLGYISQWQSTITNYPAVTHISDPMSIQGTLFRGVTEADGGNHCHIVSSDHPIMSLLRIPGGNWQSNGGGEALYMPYSTYWDETQTVVHPSADSGYCMIWAIVNAIPTKWYQGCTVGDEEGASQSLILDTQLSISPNPSSNLTSIKYYLKTKDRAIIKLYDAAGRTLKLIVDETKERGNYNITLDTKNFGPGIYFITLEIGGNKTSRKLILTR